MFVQFDQDEVVFPKESETFGELKVIEEGKRIPL
jgi:hypothetical protein